MPTETITTGWSQREDDDDDYDGDDNDNDDDNDIIPRVNKRTFFRIEGMYPSEFIYSM